ncbi:MAG: hypothetical protein K9L31_00005, partial [Candidatus Pacebacteria bacterium]|nr:hypothetical protein [Candidatus Paceibacterota bacterium]
SGAYGYTTTVSLFPNKENEAHVADIIFTKSEILESSLYPFLQKRCTNRKDCIRKILPNEEKKQLTDSISDLGFDTFKIVDDDANMEVLGHALAVNERVLFENKYIHDFFYDHIIWDKKDEDKAGGFFVDTLEFLPHQLKAVKLLKHWWVLKILNVIPGVSKIISKENGEKYAKSAAFGAIIMEGSTKENYVNTGRSVQRVWLTATKLGIAMHPCNGTIYFLDQITDNGGKEFSIQHHKLIKDSNIKIRNAFNVTDSKISFIFRIGKADEPTARSKRLKPIIKFVN